MTILLALMGISQAVAQEYEYVPFVREGVKWECDDAYLDWGVYVHQYFTLEIFGDTIIDGKCYKAMHKYSGNAINKENDTIPVYLREENKVVYGIVPDGKTYAECPVGINNLPETLERVESGQEFVLYDFSDPVGFIKDNVRFKTEDSPNGYPINVVIPDMITVGVKKVHRYIVCDWNLCLIEGFGCDGISSGYPLGCPSFDNHMFWLCRVIEDGDTIYTTKREEYWSWPGSYKVLPIPRQGVQWVNERVIVENGDTTRTYYKYEFRGATDNGNGICYSYTSDTLDISIATFVAAYQCDNYHANTSNGNIYNNMPFLKVLNEHRSMIFNVSKQFYHFDKHATDIQGSYPPNWYIYQNQVNNFLTRENLVEVEPLIIEDIECERFAYIGESGDTLAYIVQGIGFDSYDMGDLLTPFTRKPDPNADYQEWCGLSHVVKDGKIIYKGMRYRPNVPGDVNGDGEVTVGDANSVIDVVIMGGNAGHTRIPATDVNGDGEINIGDVNAIIDIILSQNAKNE